jgi:hypothetical protein
LLYTPGQGKKEQQKSITTADLEDTNSNAFCMKNSISTKWDGSLLRIKVTKAVGKVK